MANTPSAEDFRGGQSAPLPILPASELGLRATDRAFHDIRRLANILSRVNLDARREDLLDYIRPNRARFLKAYAIISWLAEKHGELVVNASNALAEAGSQREQIDTCQDQFFFMHGGLFGARQRVYDVPVAMDVLIGGQYPRLPKGIHYCGGDIDPRPIFELPANREAIVPRVNRAIRLALLRRGGVPDQFTSHNVTNGVLTLSVDGEFQLMFTLQAEREDAKWTLLGVKLEVQAREGESITAPIRDYRQQRYLHEVVQKAMDVHVECGGDTRECGGDTRAGANALLAAYQVCHDLCCSMVLEILHAQAQKLATRVGGLWATKLVVTFHKASQVLDLCLWQKEYSSGLGGTGRDVGVGGIRVGEDRLHPQQATASARFNSTGPASLPPPPVGCRYLRVHRPVDRNSQIVASLGPPGEFFKESGLGLGNGAINRHAHEHEHESEAEVAVKGGEALATDAKLASLVQVHPGRLSCARMLLAAARTFASHKIKTLSADVEAVAGQLGISVPAVVSDGGLSACICPWGGGAVEVSVDVRSGRYLVKDTLPSGTKAMASCGSRLQDALNLLPGTDLQSLEESIAATLTAGRSVLNPDGKAPSAQSVQNARNGEQPELRQQQVRRCMGEAFGLLRRCQIDHAFRRTLGMVPHERWQALLGRTDTGVVETGAEFARLGSSGTLRSSVRLSQFRENGVLLSDEWRERARSHRIRRRAASAIELTRAERAATTSVGHVHTSAPAGVGGVGVKEGALDVLGSTHHLAASLAEVEVEASDGGDAMANSLSGWKTGRGERGTAGPATPVGKARWSEDTAEVLSFFLEVGITGNLDVEHTVVAAALPTTGRARNFLRPVVAETYQLFPCHPQSASASPCGSLEAALLPLEPPATSGAKRPASFLDAGGDLLGGTNGITQETHDGRGGLVPATILSHLAPAVEAAQAARAQLPRVVQMFHRLIPFARLQHALVRVGTGLSLDFRELTHFSEAKQQVPSCAVFLAGEHGWSSPEVAATSARVSFLCGHTQSDTWEWDVTLGWTTTLMDYGEAVAAEGESTTTSSASVVVREQLPLAQHVVTGSNPLGLPSGKHVRFRFPPSFSVHAMCRSFALAGEGLAAMQTLAAQASELRHAERGGAGYAVVSCSPIHVAMCNAELDHVVLLTHSAFSARHTSSAERPGLVLIPWPHEPTCPVAMRELEASVRKHRDLNALLHALSRTVAVLAVLSRAVPGVGCASGTHGDRSAAGGKFVLTAVSPAKFVLSAPSPSPSLSPSLSGMGRQAEESLQPNRSLTLMVETGGRVRVSRAGGKDVLADTAALRDLLLEWIASTPTSRVQ